MAKQVHTATEAATGRTWLHYTRRIYGRLQYAAIYDSTPRWFDSLTDAKKDAKARGRFRYDDEPALETRSNT